MIGDFYSKYFTYVNIAGLSASVVRGVPDREVPRRVEGRPVPADDLPGRLQRDDVFPTLTAVLSAKVAENSTDYSINNTVRNMLFLPCTYEEKFSGKQAIDSFFVRMGDVLSAGLVFLGTAVFSIQPRQFALVNAIIVVAWLALAWRVGRGYDSLTEERSHAPGV